MQSMDTRDESLLTKKASKTFVAEEDLGFAADNYRKMVSSYIYFFSTCKEHAEDVIGWFAHASLFPKSTESGGSFCHDLGCS